MFGFRADFEGMREWLNGPEAIDITGQAAKTGLEIARATAPVGTPPRDQHPGEYRDGLYVQEGARSEKGDRYAALLIASSEDAIAVEFGNHHRPAQHVLRNVFPHEGA